MGLTLLLLPYDIIFNPGAQDSQYFYKAEVILRVLTVIIILLICM